MYIYEIIAKNSLSIKVLDFNSKMCPKFDINIGGKVWGYPYGVPFPNYKASKTFVWKI